MTDQPPSRDELCLRYLEQLPYPPYPVQEEALLAWFSAKQGVLVCTPTGTGKTMIAEAALFEALHTGKQAYYTTPLIALTEQKFHEMQSAAARWGFDPRDVGLVTGNRHENPQAPVLVVVAEILLNRLLHTAAFDFSEVSAVVMDEFHSFTDPERGVVWELSLGLLPPHVRTLLLSATVGNAMEFILWLRNSHARDLELVKGEERKVPLSHHWVGDMLLAEQIEDMARGDVENRKTPTLIFCFNRDECWNVAEQLKGKKLLSDGQQARLTEELKQYDLSKGAGSKLRQLLLRGVGVHHAGLLPKYRRVVEELFQRKLLSVAVCTETLSAGINLPARSVLLPTILKGPPEKKRILEPSSAQQIFGRAGRPQFDKQGYVYVLAHEDDVRIARWRERFDQIPEDTKDPGLLRVKKDLKRKMPKRRDTEQYWNEAQFQKLCAAPSGKLHSRGALPWRLLGYMLDASAEVDRIRKLVGKRLMDPKFLEAGQRELDRMLVVLHHAGYVRLEPSPPELEGRVAAETPLSAAGLQAMAELAAASVVAPPAQAGKPEGEIGKSPEKAPPRAAFGAGIFDHAGSVATGQEEEPKNVEQPAAAESPPLPTNLRSVPGEGRGQGAPLSVSHSSPPAPIAHQPPITSHQPPTTSHLPSTGILLPPTARLAQPGFREKQEKDAAAEPPPYRPVLAYPTAELQKLALFRSVNPLYGMFLINQLGIADRRERIQAMESVLEFPRSVARFVRVPKPDELPSGPLATLRLDQQLLQLGLATAEELVPRTQEEQEEAREARYRRRSYDADQDEEPKWVLSLAEKLRRLFDYDVPGVLDLRTQPVWAAGELLDVFHGDFDKFVTSKGLQKQEGILFRHLLRLILLVGEFLQLSPPDTDPAHWAADLDDIARLLIESCRQIDPASTDRALEQAAELAEEEAEAAMGNGEK